MAFEPLVSIVIPVYNGANYLSEAIESALAQSYARIEVLVVNDGSDDSGATETIALGYRDRIRYFAKSNGGVASALNFGIEQMQGDYFSWLSHDDVYYPDKIATQITSLASREERDRRVVLFSDFDVIDRRSQHVRSHRIGPLPKEAIFFELLCDYPVNGCTVLIPHSCFHDVGHFDPALRTTQDYHFWFRLAKRIPMVHLDQPLIGSRVHPEQGTHTLSQHAGEADSLYCWALDFLTVDDIAAGTHRSPAEAYYQIARSLCWRKRAFRAARRALQLSSDQLSRESWRQRLALGPAIHALRTATYASELPTQAIRKMRRLQHWAMHRKPNNAVRR